MLFCQLIEWPHTGPRKHTLCDGVCQLTKWPHARMPGRVNRPVCPLVLIYNSMVIAWWLGHMGSLGVFWTPCFEDGHHTMSNNINSGYLYSAHIRHSVMLKGLQHWVFAGNVGLRSNYATYSFHIAPCNGLQGNVAQYAANQTRKCNGFFNMRYTTH